MSNNKWDHSFKILLLGDLKVGKSSIMRRFINDIFNNSYETTIPIDFGIKEYKFKEKLVKLQIWDTAGENRFHSIYKANYGKSNGIILIYDLENLDSFKKINNLIKEIEESKALNSYKVLVGNKCDSLDRVVTEEEGKKLADNYKMDYFEISAKNDQNIIELFYHIVNEIIKSQEKNKTQCA